MLMNRPRARLLALIVLGAFVVGALATLLVGPHRPGLGSKSTGDPQLVADVRASLVDERGFQMVSAGRIVGGHATFAGISGRRGAAPTPQTRFELGSITKTFTGSLLADGVRRGELKLEAPVSTYLTELAGTPVGAVTLRQLATHTGGLPPFPDSMRTKVVVTAIANANPYAGSTAAMVAAARTTKVGAPGTYHYSNLGMSLVGHAEARAAGAADWPTLATARLLTPLGMTNTTFAMSAADVPADAARPHLINGWSTANWWGPAFAPAGSSTWTTAEDLLTYAQALLDGSAPGAGAMDPLLAIPSGQIGLAWHLIDVEEVPVTWHNGATGGYRTILALDRARGQAVIILSNSARDADLVGLRLAATAPGAPVPRDNHLNLSAATWAWPVVGLALWLSFAYTTLRGKSRLALVGGVLTGAAGLLALLAHGPWATVPPMLWGGLVGLSLVLVGVVVRRGRTLASYAERRRVWGWLSLGLSLATLVLVAWTT